MVGYKFGEFSWTRKPALYKAKQLKKKKKIVVKFERILEIYWSKGLLINGLLTPFNSPLPSLLKKLPGYSATTTRFLIRRFELYQLLNSLKFKSSLLHPQLLKSVNIFFSNLTSVNNTPAELIKYNLIRLLLIKSTRGRSHALGKPSRGQRTWSNAWTSYNVNKVTRTFISTFQRLVMKPDKKEVINYKKLQVKQKVKRVAVGQSSTKLNKWF